MVWARYIFLNIHDENVFSFSSFDSLFSFWGYIVWEYIFDLIVRWKIFPHCLWPTLSPNQDQASFPLKAVLVLHTDMQLEQMSEKRQVRGKMRVN